MLRGRIRLLEKTEAELLDGFRKAKPGTIMLLWREGVTMEEIMACRDAINAILNSRGQTPKPPSGIEVA